MGCFCEIIHIHISHFGQNYGKTELRNHGTTELRNHGTTDGTDDTDVDNVIPYRFAVQEVDWRTM